MPQTFEIIISGKVQGVFFRQSTKEKAEQLNITGLVKNLPNGTVYVKATGNDDALQEFIAWCWQGPRKAAVCDVAIDVCALQIFDSFNINR